MNTDTPDDPGLVREIRRRVKNRLQRKGRKEVEAKNHIQGRGRRGGWNIRKIFLAMYIRYSEGVRCSQGVFFFHRLLHWLDTALRRKASLVENNSNTRPHELCCSTPGWSVDSLLL